MNRLAKLALLPLFSAALISRSTDAPPFADTTAVETEPEVYDTLNFQGSEWTR